MQWGKHDQPLLSFSRELSVLRAPVPRYVSLYNFILFYIYLQHACANINLVKTHRHPPCPPPRKRTGEASSHFSGGKNHEAGFRSQRAGAGTDGKGRGLGLAHLHSLHVIHLRFPLSTATTAPPQWPPREPTLHASLPIRPSHKLCVTPLV